MLPPAALLLTMLPPGKGHPMAGGRGKLDAAEPPPTARRATVDSAVSGGPGGGTKPVVMDPWLPRADKGLPVRPGEGTALRPGEGTLLPAVANATRVLPPRGRMGEEQGEFPEVPAGMTGVAGNCKATPTPLDGDMSCIMSMVRTGVPERGGLSGE